MKSCNDFIDHDISTDINIYDIIYDIMS